MEMMPIGIARRGAINPRRVLRQTGTPGSRASVALRLRRGVQRAERAACFFGADLADVARGEEQTALAHRGEHFGGERAASGVLSGERLPELLADVARADAARAVRAV